ncbi:MAG: hypothetical protein WBK55_08205 [Alphaproteobacteria bacterium]
MEHDLANNLQMSLHYAGAYTTTQTPAAGADLQGLVNPTFIVAVGALGASSPNAGWRFSLQESDTADSDFANVSGADMVTDPDSIQPASVSNGIFVDTIGDTEDNDVYRVTYKGIKRYARVIATAVDEPPSTTIAVILAGQPNLAPAAT